MRIKFLAIILFLILDFFSYNLYSQKIIRSINLEGLKRTRDDTIYYILDTIKVGSQYTALTTNQMAQKLYKENIFKPNIDFDVVENGDNVDITIIIEDRWTLVPLPVFSLSNNSYFVGIMLTENNLFGFNKKLGLSGFYGSAGYFARIEYNDKKFILDNLNFNLFFDVGYKNIISLNVAEDIVSRQYENLFSINDFRLTYNFFDSLLLGAGIKYEYYGNVKNIVSTVEDINSLGLYGFIGYKNVNYEYPFEEGVSTKISGGHQFSLINNKNYYSIEGEVHGAYIINSLQRIGGALLAGYGDLPGQKEFLLGGSLGKYTLPQAVTFADYHASTTFYYEISFLDIALPNKAPFGRGGFQLFYEVGFYGSDVLGDTLHHGPGIGALFYLSGISLPALEFKLAFDVESMNLYFRFGISRYL